MRAPIWILPAIVFGAVVAAAVAPPVEMPGKSYSGDPPPLSIAESALRDRLRAHVHYLAREIGERNRSHYEGLERSRRYIETTFRESGYRVRFRSFDHQGDTFHNVEAVLDEVADSAPCIVVGAHYDSVTGSPGANDNASGVAALLELARLLRGAAIALPVRYVAFANEEPPYFNTREGMGSVEYVRRFGDAASSIRAMLSIETVGMYRDEPGSQKYPPPVGALYPDCGNFIGFVSDLGGRNLVRRAIDSFRASATLPSEGAVFPSSIPGISWSDHRSFSEAGIPAAMVTDTAPFRDPHYHLSTDTPERLDYDRMARLVVGLAAVVPSLVDSYVPGASRAPTEKPVPPTVGEDAQEAGNALR